MPSTRRKAQDAAPVYDLAVSYAGADRKVAEKIATALKRKGYRVYYDRFEPAKLLGEDLTTALGEIYEKQSRYCLVLISKSYVAKPWTNHERQFALSRALQQRRAYILPLKLDGTDLPGLSPSVGYLDIRNSSVPEVCRLLAQKLGAPAAVAGSGGAVGTSRARIREVLSTCYRRAVFTRYHAQIDSEAMFASLADCRVALQKLVIHITPADNQHLVAGIIGELDLIERANASWNKGGRLEISDTINGCKLRVIHALVELARRVRVPLAFPQTVTEDLLFSVQDANRPPTRRESPMYRSISRSQQRLRQSPRLGGR